MAAFAGLRALGHLDLDLQCAVQVGTRHAEAAGSHLLHRAVPDGTEAVLRFSALAGVGFSSQSVHGLRHGPVGLLGDGAVGHGSGLETLHQAVHTLHLADGHRLPGRHELQKRPQRVGPARIVHHGGVLPEFLIAVFPHRLLEKNDGLRPVQVVFLLVPAPQRMEAAGVKGRIHRQAQGIEGVVMPGRDIFADLREADAADAADGPGEILVDEFFPETDGFEDPGRLIGLDRGDPHLRRGLYDAAQQRLVVIRDGSMVILVQQSEVDEFGNAFVGQVGVHGPYAEAQKGRDLMHVPGFAALQDQGHRRPLPGLHQVLFHGRHRQQRRDRHMVLVHAAVRENNDVGALGRGPVHGNVELGQGLLQGSVLVEQKRDDPRPEILPVQSLDGQKLYPGQDRRIQLQDAAVPALFLKKISVGAKVDRGVRHHLLP